MAYEKTYFHGTDASDFDPAAINPVVGRYDLCVTDEREVAERYAEEMRSDDTGGEPTVWAITVDRTKARLADEEEAEEVIKEVYGVDHLDMWLFEYLDDPQVMEAIVEAGFGGVDFVDQCPTTFEEHDTTRLYIDAVVSCERV